MRISDWSSDVCSSDLWRLLTTHAVTDVADARRITGFYRQRWTIEQLFRTLKTKGFAVAALRPPRGGTFAKRGAPSVVAAVTRAHTCPQVPRQRRPPALTTPLPRESATPCTRPTK